MVVLPVAVLAAALLAAVPAQSAPASVPPAVSSATDRELRAIEEQRRTAIKTHDAAALETIYADDFQAIAGNGQVIDRRTLMGVFARTPADVTFSTTEIAVRGIDATTALFTGRLTGTDSSGQVVSDARFTHVFVRRAGRWWCVAGQSTPIAAPPSRHGTFFAVSAKDAAVSATWYRDRLGFETLREGASPDGRTRFALLRRGDDLIELVQREGASAPPAVPDRSYELGFFKTGFWVDDLAALETRLKVSGTAFSHGIVTPPGASYQTFAVTDPDGNVVQFFGEPGK